MSAVLWISLMHQEFQFDGLVSVREPIDFQLVQVGALVGSKQCPVSSMLMQL
jgi:hypothetical protein